MATGMLGRIDLKSPEDLEVIKTRLSVYDDAMKTLSDRGLSLPEKPAGDFTVGDLPHNMTMLDDNSLGNLLGQISEYCGYAESELAKASAKKDIAIAHLDSVRARVRIGLKSHELNDGAKLTIKDKDDMVETNPVVVEARANALYTNTVYLLTKTILNRFQRNWDTVSRRITQRGQEIERMKREVNVSNIPRGNNPFRR